jgi:NADH:ubiquinone oxidoreductase subunit 5 (subunit L)/multisubunit Na+/H+ antiporter MnhA subunit
LLGNFRFVNSTVKFFKAVGNSTWSLLLFIFDLILVFSRHIVKNKKKYVFLFIVGYSYVMFCPHYEVAKGLVLGFFLKGKPFHGIQFGDIKNCIFFIFFRDPFNWLFFLSMKDPQLLCNLCVAFFLSSIEKQIYFIEFLGIIRNVNICQVELFSEYEIWNQFVLFKYSCFDFFNATSIFTVFTFFAILFVTTIFFLFFAANFLGLYGVFMLSTITLGLFWASSLFTTYYVLNNNLSHVINFGKWFVIYNDVVIYFEFYLDNLSLAFTLLVLTIAFFINVYTFAYFRYEPNVTRLILFIDSFVISMVILVLAGNLIILYFGWEMIGVTSFFLINFWSTRTGTLKAAFKAFVFNKISDCFILIGTIILVNLMLEANIVTINETISLHSQSNINFIHENLSTLESVAFCFMISAFIKSAQFGFHIWLPDSMEAPVPASALIHSATLVSAGIFLILRLYPLFELAPYIKNYILFFGALTAFFGGVCAVFQTDVKRLLAYSTISHCGVLMFLTFFKNPDIVIIYLYTHGLFKALIFMCMGHVIRFANNHQDMRRMGGFYKYLPFEANVSLICLANLGGVSFTWGFYMKHFLLVDGSPQSYFNLICFILVLMGSLTGIIYSYKLYYYVFFDFKKARKHVYFKILNNKNKNIYYTNSSLASNISISGLLFFSYLFCAFLIFKYLSDHNIFFDLSYFSNYKNNLKNFNSDFLINLYFYINWFIIILLVFILFNNWRNGLSSTFSLKFFIFCWVFLFFFYFFYILLIN